MRHEAGGWYRGIAAVGAMFAVVVGMGRVAPAGAAGSVTFTVSVSSAYLRASPDANATPTYSVFKGQYFAVTRRSLDSSWIALDYAGGVNGTWIRASFGEVQGNLATVAVGAGAASVVAPAATGTPAVASGPAAVPLVGPVVMNLTITANSTYVRDWSDWTAHKTASLFRGQKVGVVARDADSQWLLVSVSPAPGWVPAGVGRLDGEILRLPVAGAKTVIGPTTTAPPPLAFYPATGATPDKPMPAWIPVITPRMRALYWKGLSEGRDPRVFTIAGDCNSEPPYYLELVAVGAINTSSEPYLNSVIQQFRPSFFRKSLAVDGGATSSSVQSVLFSDPRVCQAGEGPFACELRLSRASIVFIMLGTGDHRQWDEFESNYRQLIETSLSAGALPVVMTKPDGLEWEEGGAPPGYINDVIRRLGSEYEVPVLDFWLAAQGMAHGGLQDEPGHDFHYSAEAMGVHVIATLQTLYAIWR